MLNQKDIATGCMAIAAVIVAVAMVPILFLFFKFSLLAAIPVGIILGIVVSVGVLGKMIRSIFYRNY